MQGPAETQTDPGRRYKHRAAVRRYCLANRLVDLWTFTFAEPCYDRQVALKYWRYFKKRLTGEYGKLPWAMVLELHENGSYHIHVALPAGPKPGR